MSRKDFNNGYLIACCTIMHLHDEDVIAADVLRELGLKESEIPKDLNEYDARALQKLRELASDDPIIKDRPAIPDTGEKK